MIRSSSSCRNLLVRRCNNEISRVIAAVSVTTAAMPLSAFSQTTPETTTTIRRGFRHLAMGNNSSFSSYNQNQNQQQQSSQSQPQLGQSPSQHHNNNRQTSMMNNIQIRTVFIQTENTPNPESIKFLPSNTLVLDNEDGTGHFLKKTDPIEEVLKSPLARDLFKIDGVKAVYFGGDFVTVTKRAEAKWQFMRPEIFSVLMDFFEDPTNAVLLDKPQITDTTILEDDDEIVAMIKELIEDRIRPAVQEDGGDIHYRDFDEETGMVTVQLAGSCVGCPSSSITLKQGVENMLMHYIPEVTAVQALEEEEEEDGDFNGEEDSFGEEPKTQKTYEERLAAAGIPFSD